MNTLRVPLRVVFYKESNRWVAHCLEFDLCGDGNSQKAALKCLNEMIIIQVEEVRESGNIKNLFSPADGKFFQMFAAGKNIAVGDMKLHVDSINIESSETREYSDEFSDGNLVTA